MFLGQLMIIRLERKPMKISKAQLIKIIREELNNPQSDDATYKKGIRVKDINPDCPHYKSEGVVIKAGRNEITYVVDNTGPTYQPGDELTKSKDQVIPLNAENIKSLEEGASSAHIRTTALAVVNRLYETAHLRKRSKNTVELVAEILKNNLN